MQRDLILAVFVVIFGASGTYLMLPHAHGARKPRNVHAAGAALGLVALLLFALFLTPPRPAGADVGLIERWVAGAFFYGLALGSVACGVLTVTSRDPVHSALWFAAVVLATCGLFLMAGAQFLAAGTVIVYAGAIIVTFLFVIMLAQMEGRAPYDRAARMPFRATWTCFILFLGVLWALFHAEPPYSAPVGAAPPPVLPRLSALAGRANPPRAGGPVAEVIGRAVRPTARLTDDQGRPKRHVAGLGETLYTDHLITVELAGALLFVALVGALAIATPKPPVRPGAAAAVTAPTAANL